MADANYVKRFMVVKLYCHDKNNTIYPVVPSNWVNEELECVFPDNLKVTAAIEKRVEKGGEPDNLWPTFPVEIVSTTGMSMYFASV